MSPDLRHLRYFVAVAEELSYTRAAKRVNVVPQALSAAIQQLEQELGVQLLIRTTRKVQLTDAGRALLEGGRAALDSVERSWSLARLAAGGRPPELRIAYTYSAACSAVPVLHDAVVERLPDVTPTWWEAWSGQVVEGVATGRFDAGMARYPERVRDLACETVANEPQVVVLSSRHRLAGREPIGLEALAGETILLFPREMAPGYHDALLEQLRSAGLEPHTAVAPDTGHATVILSILESGAALTVAPIGAATEWLHRSGGDLAMVRLGEATPPVPLDIVWNPGMASPIIEEFVELARALGRDGTLLGVEAVR
jgi:DNA-binding transcriptional LysR family regulator